MHFSGLNLEPLQRKDNLELGTLIRDILKNEFGFEGAGYASGDPSLNDMFSEYSQSRYGYFVLRNRDGVIGGAGFAPLKGGDLKVCELQKMYLHSDARGHGFGGKLLEKCLDAATQMGYKVCYLETTNEMIKAQALYEKFGFEQCEKLGDTGHLGCDLYYQRKLEPSGPFH